MPVQDVKTSWNSTFLMLRRAKRLRRIFTLFALSMIVKISYSTRKNGARLTTFSALQSRSLSIHPSSARPERSQHTVFKIYNKIFEHFEQSMKQLRRKKIPWKKQILAELEAGRLKLDENYSQTDSARGHIYAVATMLAPANKFQFFFSKDWDKKWRDIYRKAIIFSLILRLMPI